MVSENFKYVKIILYGLFQIQPRDHQRQREKETEHPFDEINFHLLHIYS